ncbi:DinB family protein [Streptomyces sp. NPDC001933]|uniref:DinB family protein n=1 Tax=Streptomyces sp. NPDC001933 TaxID=3364626 RepID=UPI00369E0A08
MSPAPYLSSYPSRKRPAHEADERTQLVGWLDTQRATARWKCEELSEADAHRPVLPSSPLMTMAGVMSHLRWAEHLWFEVVLLGRPAVGPMFDEPEDADMRVEGVPLAELLDDYDRQVAVSNEIFAAQSLDDVGRHPDFDASGASLRWIMFHMIEETARHAGHLDAIRELLDGRTGHY